MASARRLGWAGRLDGLVLYSYLPEAADTRTEVLVWSMNSSSFELEVAYDLRVRNEDLPVALRPFLHEVYETGTDVPPGVVAEIPVSATTDPVLNVTFSGTLTIILETTFRIPPVALAGPQPAAYRVEAQGELRGLYVRFATVAPLVLFGVTDFSIPEEGAPPFHDMVRPSLRGASRAWCEALLNATNFEERVELTCEFLLDQVQEPDARARLLQSALAEIDAAGGNVRISDLAARLGVGESTLRRHFRLLGMSPKRYASIVRFRRTHEYLRTTPGATWIDAVEQFGYADQAHFVREYTRFSGGPPTQWDPKLRKIDLRMGIEGGPE